MGKNLDIESAAREAVVEYERNRGRTVVPGKGGRGSGFDLMTSGNSETREIEIKSTDKPYLSSRWLEPLEYKALASSQNFWIYAVLNASSSPLIKPFSKNEWERHFDREEVKRWYKFSRIEFSDAEKP